MPTQFCTNHKNRETLRVCGRCERPFCPDCLVTTPVGGRCRQCAAGPKIARLRVVWWRWLLVAAVSAVGAALGMVVMTMSMWFMLIVSIAAGQILAHAALQASGRKPGRALTAIATVSIAFGAVGTMAFWTGFGIYEIVGAALMTGAAYMRLR